MSCSFISDESPCDNVGIGTSIMPLVACNRDMNPLLESIGVSSSSVVSEADLLMNRAGYFTVSPQEKAAMTVCPKHRKSLTSDWAGRKSNKCAYPFHKGEKRKLAKPRRVNAIMSTEIYDEHRIVVPIGSGKNRISFSHKNKYLQFIISTRHIHANFTAIVKCFI